MFELFYQDITLEMNPPGMPKWQSEGMYLWWRERFINAYFGHKEPKVLSSWAEAPQMWLKGYNRGLKENNFQ